MNDKPENTDKRIPKDKDNIKVTPFGTKKEKRDVPDQEPKEEFIEPKPNQKSEKIKRDSK
ncbi:hypothetical protein SYJ56_24600 [Algoriphagus sp. D3-2-R+10]|uniref:hypothetical protein n=1 Tax=Algoriphagus aurantiacus TaxID=3103948 RepID=UPI002B3D046B|nr:hypothetical protein [Algoriphagus sp. D3-2-R+10]MEB2778512.1 hypothetical protein [Algoriphagus sp. D3-2-R+10]